MDVGRTNATYGSFFYPPKEVVSRGERKDEPVGDPADAAPRPEEEKKDPQPMLNLLNRVMQRRDHKVKLTVHESTNRVIIRITDSETGEVIREIPRESYLDMVASFLSNVDKVHGMSLDEMV